MSRFGYLLLLPYRLPLLPLGSHPVPWLLLGYLLLLPYRLPLLPLASHPVPPLLLGYLLSYRLPPLPFASHPVPQLLLPESVRHYSVEEIIVFFVVPLDNGRASRREERYLVLDDVGRESSWGHTEQL